MKSTYEKLHPLDYYLKTNKNAKITNSDTPRYKSTIRPEVDFSAKYSSTDRALHFAENMTSYSNGGHENNVQKYFDRLYSVYPEMELDNLCQYVFLVRPDLNIYTSNGSLVTLSSSEKQSGYHPNSSPGETEFFKYMNKRYPYILKSLSGMHWDHGGHDFIPYLVGRTESLQIPDYTLKQYDVNQPYTGYKLPYAGHALDSITGGSFDITFREDNEFRIHKLFQAWTTYISNVTRNVFGPKVEYIRTNVIDYATSVYCITCKPDAETIVYWTKYTGAFPINVPNSDLSFNLRGGVNNKVNISFNYFLQEALDPNILIDFNKNAHVTNVNSVTPMPLYRRETLYFGKFKDYRTSKMKVIDGVDTDNLNELMTLGTGNGIAGTPYISQDKNGIYYLRWRTPYHSTSTLAGQTSSWNK